MIYYNIHTHHPTDDSKIISIVNNIILTDNIKTKVLKHSYSSVGIHPWYIENPKVQIRLLKEVCRLPQVKAIGEAGLDKLVEIPLNVQSEVFSAQIQIAEEIRKPLIIHCVKAWDELIALKKELSPKMPWVIHGFRGKKELAEQLIHLGFYLSLGEKFNEDALWVAWPDKLLTETDESILPIQNIYSKLSSILSVSIDEFGNQIDRNVHLIFSV